MSPNEVKPTELIEDMHTLTKHKSSMTNAGGTAAGGSLFVRDSELIRYDGFYTSAA